MGYRYHGVACQCYYGYDCYLYEGAGLVRYYVRVVLTDGTISQEKACFSTLEMAKVYKRAKEGCGCKATIYEIELTEVEE